MPMPVSETVNRKAPAAAKDLHIFALLRRQGRLRKKVCDTDDRVHWRSDIMTHARQEIRLGLARALGGSLGLPQFGFHPLALSNVARCGENSLQCALSVVKGGGVIGYHRLLSVAGAGRQFVIRDLLFA